MKREIGEILSETLYPRSWWKAAPFAGKKLRRTNIFRENQSVRNAVAICTSVSTADSIQKQATTSALSLRRNSSGWGTGQIFAIFSSSERHHRPLHRRMIKMKRSGSWTIYSENLLRICLTGVDKQKIFWYMLIQLWKLAKDWNKKEERYGEEDRNAYGSMFAGSLFRSPLFRSV